MNKVRLGIVYGHNSAEAEGSLRSARHILANVDPERYEIHLVYVDKNGGWWLQSSQEPFSSRKSANSPLPSSLRQRLAFSPGGGIMDVSAGGRDLPIDVVFLLIPGPAGEDGTVQGMLKLAKIPFVGADVQGSAVAMDKDVTKRLCREAGIPVPEFLVATRNRMLPFGEVEQAVGLPFFVKPANMGSSVGIAKVGSEGEFEAAVEDALLHDNKLVFEEAIVGKEVEIAALGSEEPALSDVAELDCTADWYSYEAKFLDPEGSDLVIPARIPRAAADEVRRLAVEVWRALGCEGMARIDFFVDGKNRVLFNEINTLPCMSGLSTFPRLWEAAGVPASALVDRLVALALERFERDERLRNWHEGWELTGIMRPRSV